MQSWIGVCHVNSMMQFDYCMCSLDKSTIFLWGIQVWRWKLHIGWRWARWTIYKEKDPQAHCFKILDRRWCQVSYMGWLVAHRIKISLVMYWLFPVCFTQRTQQSTPSMRSVRWVRDSWVEHFQGGVCNVWRTHLRGRLWGI